ncbi:hypothetical protein LSH36_989g00009 [Paralvinella palmiformis]|uniref:G-protein coupled receptors family 1 profile domain-containing protein n=1 Tax=Paralvinella palmiformis TaxID=53620 RepID=A0AAD9IY06_9ANNE|nr:hypothetical protein LSH36_989g00009 [Paralvinella palmiformis]
MSTSYELVLVILICVLTLVKAQVSSSKMADLARDYLTTRSMFLEDISVNDLLATSGKPDTTTGHTFQKTYEPAYYSRTTSLQWLLVRDASNSTLIPNVESDLSHEVALNSSFSLDKHLYLINYIVWPVILLVGLFGNVMTMVVLQSKTFRITPTVRVLCALSLSDTILILMTPFNKQFFQRVIGLDVRGLHWVGCKVFFWLWRCVKMTSSWFIVLISLERFVVISYPMKARIILTKQKVIGVIVITYLLIVIYNAVRTTFSDVTRNGNCLNSIPSDPGDKELVQVLSITSTVLCTHIPVVLVFLFNITSAALIVRQSHERANMVGGRRNEQLSNKEKVERQVTGMLMGISFAFSVLLTPIAVLHAIAIFRGIGLYHTTDWTFVLVRELAMILEQLNSSINFYLYVLCSQKFRHQFVALLCCFGRSRNRQFANVFTLENGTNEISLSRLNGSRGRDILIVE